MTKNLNATPNELGVDLMTSERTVVRALLLVAVLIAATAIDPGGRAPAQIRAAAAAVTTQPAADDWPTYLHDSSRTGASGDASINNANAATLVPKWSLTTGDVVAASPSVVNGVVYEGSWDGNEYAINATTGAVLWKTFLGVTDTPRCPPSHLGVEASAAVVGGTVYVGGGGALWYALDAATGAVRWTVPTGDNSPTGGHFNWASPLIVGNAAYIGIASDCDNPLVQGQLLKVDLTTHQIIGTLKVVPDGQVGGGIWTSPAYDAVTGTVFVSTGTLNQYTQTESQAILAVDGASMAVKSKWQLPFGSATIDSDWGTTPTLSTGNNGRHLLSVANKNGILYTFDRDNLAAGPVWHRVIALGGDCPVCGDATVSSGAAANGVLYFASGNNVHNGTGHPGSVTAYDAATGAALWYHPTSAPVLAPLAYANGLVVDVQGSVIEILNATNGTSLWTYQMAGNGYAGPAVAHGMMFLGGADHQVHAFALGTPSIPVADPACPAPWTCQDVNHPAPGTEAVSGTGGWTISGGGTGAASASGADQFRLISQRFAGNNQLTATVTGQNVATGMTGHAGIIERQSADPAAPFYAVLMSPSDPAAAQAQPKITAWFRAIWGSAPTQLAMVYPTTYPGKLMIQRSGDVFTASTSTDGVHYRMLPGTQQRLVMPTSLLTGVAVDSGSATSLSNAVIGQPAVGPITVTPAAAPPAHACPQGWNCADIGDPTPVGDQVVSPPNWQLQGTGTGIGGVSDQLHFVWQPLAGDGSITTQVTSAGPVGAASKAGVMMRANTDPGSPFYAISVSPTKGTTVQWRTYPGVGNRATVALPSIAAPVFVRVSRYTDKTVSPAVTYFSAQTSPNGSTWTPVAGSTQTIVVGGGPVLSGMFALSGVRGTATPTTFGQTTTDTRSVVPPGVCPTNFRCQDVGTGFVPGSQSEANAQWSVQAAGGDIWDVYDQFHFISQPLAADGTVSARVASVGGGAPEWEKAGVMLRASADPQAPNYGVFVTPKHGVVVQWRTTQGGVTNQVGTAGVPPVYVMAGRWTDTAHGGTVYYTAYTSADGVTFTPVAGSTIALNMPGMLLAGMAADAYSTVTTLPVVFDHYALVGSAPGPAGACPTQYAGCADIGGAVPAGSQTLNGATLTVSAGGGDIWDVADQFHFVWQGLAADGGVSARVTSLTPVNPWSKSGVMIRATTDAASPYYAMLVTPGHGLDVQYRTTAGGPSGQVLQPGAAPAYVRVTRAGTTYTAYTSPDGMTWTAVPGSAVTLSMAGSLLAGLAATSHDTSTATTVAYDSVMIGVHA